MIATSDSNINVLGKSRITVKYFEIQKHHDLIQYIRKTKRFGMKLIIVDHISSNLTKVTSQNGLS